MNKKLTLPGISLVLIALILTVASSNINWGKDHWKNIIEADGKGYYAYLPAVFIYQDLNFGFFDTIEKEKYYSPNLYYDYRIGANGRVINKYYAGTAVAQLPFFLAAHGLTSMLNYDADGYSKLYTFFVNLAGIFYLLVGLYFLNILLREYGIGRLHRSMIMFVAVFGTNLFYYSVSEPAMSHVYSFAFVSVFLFCAKKYFSDFNVKYIPLMGWVLGLIVLIRPVNGMIVLALPFMAGNLDTLRKGLSGIVREKRNLLLAAVLFFAIISIQLIIYKISAGKFFVYSYGEEGFRFLSPHMIDILFSYRKGLFLYTPVYLVSLFGLVFLWKSRRFEFFSWIVFFLFVTWILSSWWMWYYGGSFSGRVYVEYLPVFMILLAIALDQINKQAWKRILVSLLILLVILCQVQTYQYRYNQIHWSEMNKEKYWDVFLRIDKLK